MLSLMDPIEIDDLVIYRDDEVPHRFFVMPDQPQIPLDDAGVPDFLFIKYKYGLDELAEGASLGGGYLQFRCSLQVPPERRERVVTALRARLTEDQQAGRKPFGRDITVTEPILARPLWTKGEVSLLTLSEKSGLAVSVSNAALPDLGGDLAGSFNMTLSPDGAEVVWSAFKDPDKQLPLMIACKLTYKAAVSASMTIKADHTHIRERLWQIARPYVFNPPARRWVLRPFPGPLTPAALVALRATVPGVTAMVERDRVREVIQSSITVEIRSDLGADAAATQTREMLSKIATDMLSERLIPALFGSPATVPGAAAPDGEAKTELRPLSENAPDSETHFTFELNQVSTVDREINPNGSLRLLIPPERMDASERSCFREMSTDDYFRVFRPRARTVGVDFERDGIAAVHVRIRYDQVDEKHPDRAHVTWDKDAVLRSKDDVTDWPRVQLARRADQGHKREYQFQTEVIYAEDLPRTTTPWATTVDRELLLTPNALGALRVELVFTARKETVESARVTLKHTTSRGETLQTSLDLSAETPKKNWFQFTGEMARPGETAAEPSYEVQITYKTAGGEVTAPTFTTTARTLEIPSPFKRVIRYTLVPQGFTEGVTSIAGDLTYEDAARGYKVVKPFMLDKASASVGVDVAVLGGGPESARWDGRINYANGSVVPLPSGVAREGTTLVGSSTMDFLEVQIIPLPDLDFEHDLQLVIVQLRYEGHAAPTIFTFNKSTVKPQTWRMPLARPDARRYAYSIKYIAYDRSRSAEVKVDDTDEPMILLDRQAALPPAPGPHA